MLMKKKFKINWKILLNITIVLAIIFGVAGYIYWLSKLDSKEMNDMRIDAHRLISVADSKRRSDSEPQSCYLIVINEDDKFQHNNAQNYVGSVSFEGDEPVIWLSDGEFLLTGSSRNFEVIRSDLPASINC